MVTEIWIGEVGGGVLNVRDIKSDEGLRAGFVFVAYNTETDNAFKKDKVFAVSNQQEGKYEDVRKGDVSVS